MLLGVLNTSIVTADGDYSLRSVTLDQARDLVAQTEGLDSAVGHEATAKVLTALLGAEVAVNRQFFVQGVGQQALVFKLNRRLDEGQILGIQEIEEIGYSLKVLTRTA